MGIIFLLCILMLSRSSTKLQVTIFQFYNKIRLWDTSELRNKCNQFMERRGKKLDKHRSSRTLHIFPVKTIAELASQQNYQGRQRKKEREVLRESKEKANQQEESEQEPLMETGERNYHVNIQYEQGLNRESTLAYLILLFVVASIFIVGISLLNLIPMVNSLQNKFSLT